MKQTILAGIFAAMFAAAPVAPGYDPVSVNPRFGTLQDGVSESGDATAGWNYNFSGGGWLLDCDTVFADNEDWTIEWTMPETILLVGLDPTAAKNDLAQFEYRITTNVSALGTDTPAVSQGSDGKTNSEFNPTVAGGDKLRFRKTGRQVTGEVYTAVHPVWEIFHMFEFEPTGDMNLQALSFFGDGQFAPRATIGQMQDILPFGQFAITGNGNSLEVRDPGVLWSIGKNEEDGGIAVGGKGDLIARLKRLPPFLGSGTIWSNVGVDGQTTQQMVDRRAQLSATFVEDRECWTFNWELANGIFTAGNTASEAAGLMKTLLDNANIDNPWAGHVVISPIPRHASYSEPTLTDLNTITRASGTLIRDNPAAYSATAYLDLCAAGEWYEFPDGYGADQFVIYERGFVDNPPNEIHQPAQGQEYTCGKLASLFTTLLIP